MSYIDNRIATMGALELRAAVKRYYEACGKQNADIVAMVAPVLGYEYDDLYGWVIGDHVAESLVAELVAKHRELTG